MSCSAQWGALVCSCCSEEQPVEVKLMAAKVLVNCTEALLTNPHLPLGESHMRLNKTQRHTSQYNVTQLNTMSASGAVMVNAPMRRQMLTSPTSAAKYKFKVIFWKCVGLKHNESKTRVCVCLSCVFQVCSLQFLCGGVCSHCCRMKTMKSESQPLIS